MQASIVPCTRAMRARVRPLQNIMPLFRGGLEHENRFAMGSRYRVSIGSRNIREKKKEMARGENAARQGRKETRG